MSARAVLVTGASTGIGAATASSLADAGFIVFAGVRDEAAARAIARANVTPLTLDVTDAAAIADAAETVAQSGHVLAGVVNNAGIAVGGPLEFLPIDELRRQFEINVFGAIAVSQAFLPHLRASRGRLVFVGSVSGRLAVPFIGPYSASKFALRALSDALRLELARAGIAVALIEPGSVKTPIWQKALAARERMVRALPPQALQFYGVQLDALYKQIEGEERGGIAVERVSAAIVHALTAATPRTNYLVGFPARAGSILGMLPAAVRDRILFRPLRG